MELQGSSIAKRTRGQSRYQFNRAVNELYERRKREKAEKVEVLEKKSENVSPICFDSLERQQGVNKRRKIRVEKGSTARGAIKGRDNDIEIVYIEEEKNENVSPTSHCLDRKQELRGRKKEAPKRVPNGRDDGKASANDIKVLSVEEAKSKNLSPIVECVDRKQELSKRRREAVKMRSNDHHDDEVSDSCIEIFPLEEKKSENMRANGDYLHSKPKLNKRKTEAVEMCRNGCDDDEGSDSDSDIKIVGEELVPVKLGNECPPKLKRRGKCSGNMISERINVGVTGQGNSRDGSQDKEKDLTSDDPIESESECSSEEDSDHSNEKDYEQDESVSSETQSDGLRFSSEDDSEGGDGRSNGKTSPAKRCLVEESEEYEEDEGRIRNKFVNDRKENGESRFTLKEMDPVIDIRWKPKSDYAIGDTHHRAEKGRKNGKSNLATKAGNVHEENIGSSESGFKRKALGLDIWVDPNKRVGHVGKSLPERLRPRKIPKSRKKKLELGKINNPVCISDREESDSSADEDFDSSANEGSHDDDHVPKNSRKSIRAFEKPFKRKTRASKDLDFMKIIVDSIWEKGDALKEKLSPLEDIAPAPNVLPLKFRFEDEYTSPPEKDEWQKEVDDLFADMELGLTENDIGSTKVSMTDDVNVLMDNPAERCQLGYHQLILREPFGIICKNCTIVHQEMKYILPNLKKPTGGKQDCINFHKGDHYLFDGLQLGDSGCENQYSSICAEGSVLNLIPTHIRRNMYLHQRDGFEFLWRNIAGENFIENLKTPLPHGGTGCIISHAPGTGKTYLTIVFLLTFMQVYPACRPVIIAPRTMLLTWADEFRKWDVNIPFHNLNDLELSGQESKLASSILRRVGTGKQARDFIRMVKLYSWTKDRSILGIGYQLFEILAGEHGEKGLGETVRKMLLELPGLLVLDEGHTPRNDNSLMWKALTKVETRRRIILSGTPFQNNFDELYNTLCLVNPNFDQHIDAKSGLGSGKTHGRKSSMAKGTWASLTNCIDKNSHNAVKKLKAMINPFVHVHKGTILQESLPGVKDTLVILRPSDLQKLFLRKIPKDLGRLELAHLEALISVDHSLVVGKVKFPDCKQWILESSSDAGVKTKFVIEVIRLSDARNEKVLVFSEYVDPLAFIKDQLTSQFDWEVGKEVLYMDGKVDMKNRQSSINRLNDPNSEVKVLLASTKACSEGINLVGASRVVLLDVVWNPSVERQAISRAYRLGQKKIVYVYRLIMSETREFEKYKRQARKDQLSELVFSSPDGQNDKPEVSCTVSDDKILEALVQHEKLHHIFDRILPQPKESKLFENY